MIKLVGVSLFLAACPGVAHAQEERPKAFSLSLSSDGTPSRFGVDCPVSDTLKIVAISKSAVEVACVEGESHLTFELK